MADGTVIDLAEAARTPSELLYEHLTRHLRREKPGPGAPFPSDADLVERFNLSRTAVRRVLNRFQEKGWIERRVGSGTVVGRRIRELYARGDSDADRPHETESSPNRAEPAAASPSLRQASAGDGHRGLLRLAVLAFDHSEVDWYTPLLMAGIDDVADELHLSQELIGTRERDPEVLLERLRRNRPDALLMLSRNHRHVYLMDQARRMGIAVIAAGTIWMDFGFPVVAEDNAQGMSLAVEALWRNGHRRIGFAARRLAQPWVFERHEAYGDALLRLGARADERLAHWMSPLPSDISEWMRDTAALEDYLARVRPTAVIVDSTTTALRFDVLRSEGRLRIPEDLSLVDFDRLELREERAGLKRRTTSVWIPLREMGATMARYARQAAEGGAVPAVTRLPCHLQEGGSVLPVDVREGGGGDNP